MIESHEELHAAARAVPTEASPVTVLSDTKERSLRPRTGSGWRMLGTLTRHVRTVTPSTTEALGWGYRDAQVVSSLCYVKGRWEWHVSVVRLKIVKEHRHAQPKQEMVHAPDALMDRVRRDFGLAEAEEDNHGPGKFTRSLWLAVDPSHRVVCPCKADEEVETTPIEGGGTYEWREDRET